MSFDVAYSIMLSEKFSIAAGVRWIYSDLTYNYSDTSSPGSAFAVDLAAYYQNYVNIGQRECQLGIGLDISNVGSKINFGGDENSEFLPANLRLGASLMVPVDEYNRFSIAVDANKPLVPTMPVKMDGESDEDFITRKQNDYYDVSMLLAVSRKRCKRYVGVLVPSMYTTTSSRCVPVIIMSRRTRATASTSQ